MTVDLGSMIYEQDFAPCTEYLQTLDGAPHAIHTIYLLTGGGHFEAVIVGTLMGAVPLNETDTLLVIGSPADCEQYSKHGAIADQWVKDYNKVQATLEKVMERDHQLKARVVLTDAAWIQANRIMVTVSALTEKMETAIGASVSDKFRGTAIAGDLLKCKVVLQREDRHRSNGKCVQVFDRTYRLKATSINRLYDDLDVIHF
ncbi:hypothetical protein DFH06DRAFT_1121432 [Mycena polygramma]|nr:hypothetical protein DFH06DRAFT_1121432 [Mycena polygramma]